MKLLLYCCKAKPYLLNQNVYEFYDSKYITSNLKCHEKYDYTLNGKIVAECDYEAERIIYNYVGNPLDDFYGMQLQTKTLKEGEIVQHSKLRFYELRKYLLRNEDDYISPLEVGHTIHIKNLHIFDEPKELDYYYSRPKKVNTFDWYRLKGYTYTNITLDKAPQNMMYCCTESGREYILISIKPEWLCKILNGEKTIEIRKKVLKEMLKNE